MSRRLLVVGISTCLLFFFAVPLSFIAYGVAGGVLGGALILGGLCLLQWPLFALLKRFGADSPTNRE